MPVSTPVICPQRRGHERNLRWFFALTRTDDRHDYSEARFNMLGGFKDRIVNITFTPRAGKYHLISVRDASNWS
jgi:uncharacterized DUF497 family protein